MRAIKYYQYGHPNEVLKLENCPIPQLKDDEVLIQVKAVGLNPRDSNIVLGKLKFVSGKKFPKGIGADFSGIVKRIGVKVDSLKIEDEVVGYIDSLDAGAAAEYIAVKQSNLVIKPSTIEFPFAAAVPCNYLTAWLALIFNAKIDSTKKIIIYGASGGVGTAAIQIAKLFGAEITTVCSEKNVTYCLNQGANYAITYEQIEKLVQSQKKYDIFFQVYSEGGLLYNIAKKVLKKKGMFITLIPNPIFIFRKFLNWITSSFSFHYILVKMDTKSLAELLTLVEERKLNPQISKRFSMDQFAPAINSLMEGHTLGKSVIVIDNQ
jgi:NADPH:quinone reductase-like Zn-dependent oxidoreductase